MLVDLSPLSHLKPCMSSFVAFGSWQISLSERSRSSSVFILFFLCAGEDLPPSNDADKDCQWEVQSDEG
jgi:hypothetical protein